MGSGRPPRSEVRVLGRVSIVDEGTRAISRSQRQLLAGLVVAGPEGMPHDRLAEILWPKGPPRTWFPALRLGVSRLREIDQTLSIRSAAGRYRLESAVGDVDAWWLDELIRSQRIVTQVDLQRGLAGRPYDDVTSCPRIDDARHLAELHQRRLVERVLSQKPPSLSDPTVDALVSYGSDECADQHLVEQISAILRGAGRNCESERLLRLPSDRYPDDLGPRSDPLVREPAAIPIAPIVAQASIDESPAPSSHTQLDRLRQKPLLGRRGTVTTLAASPCSLLLGRAGSGRTHMLAATANAIEQQRKHLVYVAPVSDGAPPLAPLQLAVPGLANVPVPPEAQVEGPTDAIRNHWRQLLGANDTHYLFDDAHRLDPATLEVVRLLAHSALRGAPVSLTISGDLDDVRAAWLDLRHDLERSGAAMLQTTPLGHRVIRSLVKSSTRADGKNIDRLSEAIADLSGGLATLVIDLIESIDPVAQQLRTREVCTVERVRLLSDLSGDLLEVGLAAAVSGTSFSVESLSKVLELPRSVIEQRVGEFWDRELIDELVGDPDQFAFRDMRLRYAILRSAPQFRVDGLAQRSVTNSASTSKVRRSDRTQQIHLIRSTS